MCVAMKANTAVILLISNILKRSLKTNTLKGNGKLSYFGQLLQSFTGSQAENGG
jgi:hypothetical protein